MLPALGIAAISGGAQLLGTGLSAASQGAMNRRSERFQERMYDRQLKDNQRLWELQNQYNSPQAQMQRFKEAGLNPNLIYGRGDSGIASQQTAPPSQQPRYQAVDFQGVGNAAQTAIAAYQNYEMFQAQTDMLRANQTVAVQDAILRAAQTKLTLSQAGKTDFDLGYQQRMESLSADVLRSQIRQMNVNADVSLSQNELNVAKNTQDLKESAVRILQMRSNMANNSAQRAQIQAQIHNIQQDTYLKTMDADLKKNGIQPGDPMWTRFLSQYLSGRTDANVPSGNVIDRTKAYLKERYDKRTDYLKRYGPMGKQR